MLHISVVLPCFNEEKNIAETVGDVLQWMNARGHDGEVMCVDDGSKDATAATIEKLRSTDPRVKLVRHDTNKGYGAAVRSGCDAATKDVIAFMDSDGQFHAEDFDILLPSLSEKTPYVTGMRQHRADNFQRKLNAQMYRWLVQKRLGISSTDINCGMKVFYKSVWPKLRPEYATGALINAEMFYRMRLQNIQFAAAPVHHYPRRAGQPTGANLRVILRMFRELHELKKANRHLRT